MKKLILLLICLLFCFAGKAQTFKYKGIYYTFINSSTVKVAPVPDGYDKYSGDIVIPETLYEIYSVVAIDDFAFYKSPDITSVVISEGVTSIGRYAFSDCLNLMSVVIPKSVTVIGDDAFSDCSSLISLMMPEGVTSIGFCAFMRCSSLTSITIPESVTTIEKLAFWGCNFVSLIIPKNVTSIGAAAFSCLFTVAPDNPNFIVKDNILFNKDLSILYLYPRSLSAKEYIVPSSVTTIGEMAFIESNLTDITIPYGVKTIGIGAFCTGKFRSITLPESITSIEWSAFSDCADLESINIPDGVTSIEDFMFCRCWNLRSIVLPERMTSIGNFTFANCTSLESINIPKGITSIGNQTFLNCSSLTQIEIPEGVTSIGSSAFSSCSGLISLTIPKEVISIDTDGFWGCTNLSDIYVHNPAPIYIHNNVFSTETYNSANLHVPQNTALAYRSTGEWKNFSTIVDDIATGAAISELPVTNIFVSSGCLVIENCLPGVRVCIYDESGILIKTLQPKFSRTEIRLPANKVYIVKIPGKTAKVKL